MIKLFGIPLRRSELSDDEFMAKVQLDIQKDRRSRLIWTILSLIMFVLMMMYIALFATPELSNPPQIDELKWLGFFSGVGFGAVVITIGIMSAIPILNSCRWLEIHRKEELLIKFYDELKQLKKEEP